MVLNIPIHRKHEDPFTYLHINVRKERESLGAGNVAHLFAEFVPPLRNQILPQTLHHVDTFCRFGQLPFGRGEDPLQPNHDQIAYDKGPHVVWPSSHELLLELDDRITYGVFHNVPVSTRWKAVAPVADLGAE